MIFLLPPAEVGYASTEAAICRCVLQNIVFLKMSQNLQAKPVRLPRLIAISQFNEARRLPEDCLKA